MCVDGGDMIPYILLFFSVIIIILVFICFSHLWLSSTAFNSMSALLGHLSKFNFMSTMHCWYWDSAALQSIAKWYIVPWMYVVSKSPPLCLLNYMHFNLQRTILAFLWVKSLVALLFNFYGLAIFCEAINSDYDSLLLLDQALTMARLTFLLDESAVAFASITDLLRPEHRILLHSCALTWITG